ncbi:MAG: Fe-S cluster assembly protein SufD [Castellaniella sp.]|uniref:Fe-S cluster assembly protein SufD n=1 Tax=Castellaniella sp. TaxID=1955812 RepID=UPI002A36A5CF|nr:Fe-S cluster assembly protein SufD [Castellaniella sp.]MDY0308919.1 Fe-S cluster assembly protein SufD [Castellaniella sp.]
MSGQQQASPVLAGLQAWADTFGRRAGNLPGAGVPWLADARRQALDRFMSEGWPTPRIEAWRHTSLAPLAAAAFDDGDVQPVAQRVAALKADMPGHWLVFVDGGFDVALSDIGALPAGAAVQPLSQAWADHAETLRAVYGDAGEGHSTSALNLALASDGAWIRLARGVVVEQPIHLVCVAASPRAAHFLRHLIQAEAGAQATVVEHYVGVPGAANFRHAATRLRLDQDARITHLKLQQESEQAWHLGEIDAIQGRGSTFVSHSVSLGARLARHDIATHFADERCETLLNGLYYVDQRRHVDHHTLIGHEKPRCVSHETYRGIMADASHGVFSGRILVAPGADGTDAIQRNDSLLLSRIAKSDARPELEIYADDVKCAHGATVGQIDEDSLFYLRSRGLDEALARDILIYAFAAASVARIESDPLRQRVERAVRALLPGGAVLEPVA